MKRILFVIAVLVAASLSFTSCSSSDDDEPKETLYDMPYNEIVYTLDSVKMFVEYAHPKDSCIFYYFGDYKGTMGSTKIGLLSIVVQRSVL